jgi:large subunit ribosomal protein L9
MAQTKVLLREDVDNLGARGEIVRVKAGYARNYLLPRKLAVEATTGNVKQIEAERGALLKREAREKTTAEQQAELVKAVNLNFTRKVGEHGILYGSVTSMDIAEALRERGYEIDRRRIQLREPIKETGEFTVNVKLHREVVVELPVIVTGEGGETTTRAASATGEETATTSTATTAGETDAGAQAAPDDAAEAAAPGDDQ